MRASGEAGKWGVGTASMVERKAKSKSRGERLEEVCEKGGGRNKFESGDQVFISVPVTTKVGL